MTDDFASGAYRGKERRRWQEPEGVGVLQILWVILFSMIVGCLLTLGVQKLKEPKTIEIIKPIEHSELVDFNYCSRCHDRQWNMERYFEMSGNKHPKLMAVAVLSTKRPKIIAAIAVKGEKNTPYTVRNGGWKKRHAGFGQVNPNDWGKVPKDPVGQAQQVDKILDELLENKPIRKALSHYGGDSTDAYQKVVLAELVRVP